MQKAIVNRLPGISLIELSQSLAIVEACGVITQVNNVRDQIKVRPPALRQALIREVFFSGVSGLSSEILDSLISYAPDAIEMTLELIHTRARGAGTTFSRWNKRYSTNLHKYFSKNMIFRCLKLTVSLKRIQVALHHLTQNGVTSTATRSALSVHSKHRLLARPISRQLSIWERIRRRFQDT